MPCYMTGSEEGDRAWILESRLNERTQELTDLTRKLCLACRTMEGNDIPLPRGLKGWWAKHKKVDGR